MKNAFDIEFLTLNPEDTIQETIQKILTNFNIREAQLQRVEKIKNEYLKNLERRGHKMDTYVVVIEYPRKVKIKCARIIEKYSNLSMAESVLALDKHPAEILCTSSKKAYMLYEKLEQLGAFCLLVDEGTVLGS